MIEWSLKYKIQKIDHIHCVMCLNARALIL